MSLVTNSQLSKSGPQRLLHEVGRWDSSVREAWILI